MSARFPSGNWRSKPRGALDVDLAKLERNHSRPGLPLAGNPQPATLLAVAEPHWEPARARPIPLIACGAQSPRRTG